jgi:hypothetical protein
MNGSGVTNFSDEDTELIQVAVLLIHETQLTNVFVEFEGSVVRIFVVQLIFVLLEVLDVSVESRFDVIIVEELREHHKLLSQELIDEIHCSVHNSDAMCTNGVSNVTDVDRVQRFR